MFGRVAAVVGLFLAGCEEPALVVYENAVIHTMDPKNPKAEVLVVRGDAIEAVGGRELIEKYGGARRVDLEGACMVPGLMDAHGHLAGLGALQRQLDLRDTRSFAEMLQRIQARVHETPKGAWILGGRWDNASWGEKKLPRHGEISKITPNHPVLLSRVDGHAALANGRALALAGITRETRDPEGGEILRDDKGEATGILVDNAIALVRRVIPEGGGAPIEELWAAGEQVCLRA
ncbi:MAG: amidohydrolase family protein, partial [Planctomycetota bacterium]|nr:amidohydrolase family protein [Planctomycetota bacterium]